KEVILQMQRGLMGVGVRTVGPGQTGAAGGELAGVVGSAERGGRGGPARCDSRSAALIAGTPEEVRSGSAWVREEDLYQCLSCGACEEACPVGIEHVGMKILDLRRGLVSEGRTTKPKVADLFTTMERSPHNPWGVSHETRRKLIEADKF